MALAEIQQRMEQDGFCILSNVLDADRLDAALTALDNAIEKVAARGISTFNPLLDLNAKNIRVDNLPDLDPVFIELLREPSILPIMRSFLGPDAYVSNFTANIALPGSRPMRIHSDQALVLPPPWTERWAMNMIWCLDDLHERNGATRYIPGSHLYRTLADVPRNSEAHTRAFEAPAGSVIAMDGRLWHTSGANVTAHERRALLFAYYTRGFIRGQVNWDVSLSAETKARLDDDARELLGMGPLCNIALALDLVALQ